MANRFTLFLVVLAVLFVALSCNQDEEAYYKFLPIPQNEWTKHHDITFLLDSSANIATSRYTISLELVHNISYPYKNLYLLVDYTLQDSILLQDTVECVLVDGAGRWEGSGNGATRQLSVPYKTNFRIDTALHNEIVIRHAMQDLNLKGIEKIGLKVY